MAATMAAPPALQNHDESPPEQEDAVYPCKGCDEILEEGKAFELAGNRWHIDCFRCNTCGTLLDSDANLLLLGDGSLICNNCTYSCNACGNKIEDLAILTGDQAFCASCFRCRNCKRKIENLRYARTSQGIFCMSCHESLMARRRKKSRTVSRTVGSPQTSVDKSLPALPDPFPTASAESRTPTERSPQTAFAKPSQNKSMGNLGQEPSASAVQQQKDNLTLPSSTYGAAKRMSQASLGAEMGDDEYFIPVALDPSPGPHQIPQSRSLKDRIVASEQESRPRDYLSAANEPSGTAYDDKWRDMIASSSRSESAERRVQRQRSNPHVAYLDKGRQHSAADVRETGRARKELGTPVSRNASPPVKSDQERSRERPAPATESSESKLKEPFKLQDAPKTRRSSGPRRGAVSKAPTASTSTADDQSSSASDTSAVASTPQADHLRTPQAPPALGGSNSVKPSSGATPPVGQIERPKRADSLQSPLVKKISRKEIARSADSEAAAIPEPPQRYHERKHSGSASLAKQDALVGGGGPIPSGMTDLSPPFDPFDANARATGRSVPPTLEETHEDFISPREAPRLPLTAMQHQNNVSAGSLQSERPPLTPLPAQGFAGDMSSDPEMSRLADGENVPSVFRRVSNAVKHGRSLSDRGFHGPGSPKWPKHGRNGSMDISSPIMASPESRDDAVNLRNRLRFSQQRITELEAEKNVLQEKVNGTVEIKQVNTELREKRSTMAFLDTQKEMAVRELEVLTEHLQQAKDSDEPMNMQQLKSEILKDFANSLAKLKESLWAEIEELTHRKNDLTGEISNLIQMKDKGFQEFESLSTKNSQLADLNNQLVHNIQELYKHGRQTNDTQFQAAPTSNGLGIYTNQAREIPINLQGSVLHDGTASQLSGDTDVDPSVVNATQVINIRKAQPKKFNWKKGGHAVAKNVTKGFKGAFGGTNQNTSIREDGFDGGLPYASMPTGPTPQTGAEAGKPSWGFLKEKTGVSKAAHTLKDMRDGSNPSLNAESFLFGSELEARCDYERRVIPNIVTTCIAEVELRGMAQEGIYRKSGSTSLVNSIKAGFESSPDYDISDQDVDIHAITSALKQYFRKLPSPLITFECYDSLIEAAAIEDEEQRAVAMRDSIDMLPKSHRDCLEFLVFHLVRVMEREAVNLMSQHNLSVIFAPTIMRSETIEREMSDMQAQRTVVQWLLRQNKVIFGISEV